MSTKKDLPYGTIKFKSDDKQYMMDVSHGYMLFKSDDRRLFITTPSHSHPVKCDDSYPHMEYIIYESLEKDSILTKLIKSIRRKFK